MDHKLSIPDDLSRILTRFELPTERPCKREAAALWRVLMRSHPQGNGVDDFPLSVPDIELLLDAVNYSMLLSVVPADENESSRENARMVWRFFLASLISIALDKILPTGAHPVVVIGTSRHAYKSGRVDITIDSATQETADLFVVEKMAYVVTLAPFMGGNLLLDPMGWALGSTIGRELPMMLICGLQQGGSDHRGSGWMGDAYLTGLVTRAYAHCAPYTNIAGHFLNYRVPAWESWKGES